MKNNNNNMKDFKSFKKTELEGKVNEATELFGDLKPIKPNTLPAEVETMLNARLGDEYAAHYLHKNAANWCTGANYPKAAAFFEGEAAAELEHAAKIQAYLNQWNLIPQIPAVPTQVTFSSLVDVVNKAYQIEYDLFEKYSADQQALFGVHQATFNFIQTYVDSQTESVAEFSDLLNALELIDPTNKLDLLFFEDKYFG